MMSELESIITSRRTIRIPKSDPIDLERVYDILKKASFAPYHSKVEPWSVTIASTLEEHQYFLKCVFESYERNQILADYSDEKVKKIKEAYEKVMLHTPVSLIVATDVFQDEKKDLESICATSTFIQNIQLLAWQKQIGAVWRTNPYILDDQFRDAFGIAASKRIIGTVHLGYFDPDEVPEPKKRRPLHEWIGRVDETREFSTYAANDERFK
ncbi:nitroreductase [Melghiribacillus thermohalophilus]|uniref:Nitroreductase n=1 Tax=Melghiribacillus thermohalophilus TaxID=1324956 RepID=A0A4V2V1L9_9BACI|nr:nitroreductase family protein [Melghiribacillus thermohalophilus]TCT21732.1 nitroreductase [Melghiribacillus thermohalophilus]